MRDILRKVMKSLQRLLTLLVCFKFTETRASWLALMKVTLRPPNRVFASFFVVSPLSAREVLCFVYRCNSACVEHAYRCCKYCGAEHMYVVAHVHSRTKEIRKRKYEPVHENLKNTVCGSPIMARYWYNQKTTFTNFVTAIKPRVIFT